MAASGTSGSHQRVTPADILAIDFKIPSFQKAVEFSSLVQPHINKIHKNYKQIFILEQLRDILLPKFMSSEIRVRIG